jgi:magnesium chelatase accessory protein
LSIIVTSTIDTLERAVNPQRQGAGPSEFALQQPGIRWAGLQRGTSSGGEFGAGPLPAAELKASGPGTTRCLDLLLLHGTAGSSHCWLPVIEQLAPDLCLLAPDLPGHGETDCQRHRRHGLDDMADDLASLLRALGYEEVRLIAGHSAGAAVALSLALGRPQGTGGAPIKVGRVLGVAPSLVPPPLLYTLLLGPALAPIVGSAPSVLTATALTRRTGLTDRLLDSTGSTIASVQRERYRVLLAQAGHLKGAIDFMAATDLPGLLRRLPGLTVPAHFMIAPDDPWIPARRLEAEIGRWLPEAVLEYCAGGHLLPESQPDRTALLMTQLLRNAGWGRSD